MPLIHRLRGPIWLTAALALPILIWLAVPRPDSSSGQLRVTFLDVGQGQCIVIETPNRQDVLIDGGGSDDSARVDSTDVGLRTVVPYLHYRGITHLALVVLTVPKADHCAGLGAVLREESVGAVLEGSPPPKSFADYNTVMQEIQKRHIPVVRAAAGMHIQLGRDVNFDVLSPPATAPQASAVDPASVDNLSLVLRLNYGSTHFLLTSDTTPASENVLMSGDCPLASNVLQIVHGGSVDPELGPWLTAVHPRWAVISCPGHNSSANPSSSTFATLAVRHIPTYTTAANGAVIFRSNGKIVTVQPTLGGAVELPK